MNDRYKNIDTINYWNSRFEKQGERTVGHSRWNDEYFKEMTEYQYKFIEENTALLFKDSGKKLLDFGCGVGRFSSFWSKKGFDVHGVDISKEMLSFASLREDTRNCNFFIIGNDGKLLFEDNSFDVIFTFTVLQHISDSVIENVVLELRRVAKKDALFILFENNTMSFSRTSQPGHVTFRGYAEYLNWFPGLNLINSSVIEGEHHSLLAGNIQNLTGD